MQQPRAQKQRRRRPRSTSSRSEVAALSSLDRTERAARDRLGMVAGAQVEYISVDTSRRHPARCCRARHRPRRPIAEPKPEPWWQSLSRGAAPSIEQTSHYPDSEELESRCRELPEVDLTWRFAAPRGLPGPRWRPASSSRLAYIQVLHHDRYERLAQEEHLDKEVCAPPAAPSSTATASRSQPRSTSSTSTSTGAPGRRRRYVAREVANKLSLHLSTQPTAVAPACLRR